MNKHNVSLNGLRVFEAAGRHLSFTSSALELNVSQAAVSQQIRSLEGQIGAKLFVRGPRTLFLSAAGEELLHATQSALRTINNALDNINGASQSNVLTISALPSFAARWLIPRLDGFQTNHPDIELHLHTSDSKVEFNGSNVDAAIRLAAREEEGLNTEFLIPDAFCLIGTPELAKKINGKRDNLYKYPLSVDSSLLLNSRTKDLTQLATEASLEELQLDKDKLKTRRFSTSDNVVLAALEGKSTALTSLSLCVDDLEAGRLIILFDHLKVLTYGTSLVYPQSLEDEPKLKVFREWLHTEAIEFNTRLEKYVPL